MTLRTASEPGAKKKPRVFTNFKSRNQWKELGFEVVEGELPIGINIHHGGMFAECQVKKKNNGRPELQVRNKTE
jgi:hypothetical protein